VRFLIAVEMTKKDYDNFHSHINHLKE